MMTLADWARASRSTEASLREAVGGVEPLPAHVGLFLDRCLIEPSDASEHPGRAALYKAAEEALCLSSTGHDPPAVAGYRPRFLAHEAAAVNAPPSGLRKVIRLEAISRLLLHPSPDGTVTEAGLLLHHTYGVPYLPGSALKGLCRGRISRELGSDLADALLGKEGDGQDGGGSLIEFWDALWIPEVPNQCKSFSPLMLDVVNPHHPDYYAARGERHLPTPGDDPKPVSLLGIRPQTRFLLVVEAALDAQGLMHKWFAWLVQQLLTALADDGVGAKLTSGYGRLRALDEAGHPAGGGGGRSATQGSGPAQLSREKGNGSLRAVMDDNQGVAEAHGEIAAQLYQGLSEQARERLKKNKPVRVSIIWEQRGRTRQLVSISGAS